MRTACTMCVPVPPISTSAFVPCWLSMLRTALQTESTFYGGITSVNAVSQGTSVGLKQDIADEFCVLIYGPISLKFLFCLATGIIGNTVKPDLTFTSVKWSPAHNGQCLALPTFFTI